MPRGYSSGATGGIAGAAGAAGVADADGFASVAGAAVLGAAGAASGFACNGSTVPAVSCGATAGRLRGTGGFPGVIAADFVTGFGATCCGSGIG
jgi:hypothetical protein